MADVSSDAKTIADFSMKLMGTMDDMGKASSPIAHIGEDGTLGFMTRSDAGNNNFVTFGEGAVIMETLQRGTSDFNAFFQDLGTGVHAMGNAAIAIADIYATTDDTNGNDLNVVDFAFADPGANRPKGLSKDLVNGQSMSDYQAQQEAKIPDSTKMSINDPGVTQYHEPGSGDVTYTFPDGSTMTVSSYMVPGPNGAMVVKKSTSFSDKSGKPIPANATTEDTEYGKNGAYTTTTRTEQVTAPDPKTGKEGTHTVKTVTTVKKDGSAEVTTYQDGKPEGKPVEVAPPKPSGDQGTNDPLSTAEKDYDSYGGTGSVAPVGKQYQDPNRPAY